MTGGIGSRVQALRQWAESAHRAGWLSSGDLDELDAVETESANALFVDQRTRPLLIGLFGGTGVGKSSLLNQLAGEEIAASGVTRPTSQHATVYIHRTRPISSLAEDSPIRSTEIRYHDDADRADLAWLDLPDIDSVEAANREVALAWLPYIDWLIYVVSPERYRDDRGWRLLQRRQNRHHWLFVINRWDEARGLTPEDFRQDLQDAGFEHPVILRTSCVGENRFELDSLESIIVDAIQQHGLAEMQRVGLLARAEQLDSISARFLQRLGDGLGWEQISDNVRATAGERLQVFRQRVADEVQVLAGRLPGAPPLWRSEQPPGPRLVLEEHAWSNYFDDLLENVGLATLTALESHGLASQPIADCIRQETKQGKEMILQRMQGEMDRALVAPGSPLQRGFQKLTRFLSYALPLLTGAWVAFNVVARFQSGLRGESEFYGFDFAVHSALFIGLSWFIPFLLHRWARPSLRASARRALLHGLLEATIALQRGVDTCLDRFDADRRKRLDDFPRATS